MFAPFFRCALGLGLFNIALSAAPLAAEPLKIAVVDVKKIMDATPHWQNAVAQLEKERLEKQTVLEKKQNEIRIRKQKIDAQKAVSSAAALAKDEEALLQEAQFLTQEFSQNQQALSMREKNLTDEMLSRVESIVRELAMNGEYTYVFETGTEAQPNVLYADPKIDLTPQILRLYLERFKDKALGAQNKSS